MKIAVVESLLLDMGRVSKIVQESVQYLVHVNVVHGCMTEDFSGTPRLPVLDS